MTDELRAPDPTLTALEPDRLVETDLTRVLPVAHRSRCEHAPRGLAAHSVEARHARWFAVPCHACFPDAPLPGMRPATESDDMRYVVGGVVGGPVDDPHLWWQVPVEEFRR